MLQRIYLGLGATALLFYGSASMFGWEFGTPGRQHVPGDVRQAPGGYRSFHFWHSGYRGGK
jgi:hypothetical protein